MTLNEYTIYYFSSFEWHIYIYMCLYKYIFLNPPVIVVTGTTLDVLFFSKIKRQKISRIFRSHRSSSWILLR